MIEQTKMEILADEQREKEEEAFHQLIADAKLYLNSSDDDAARNYAAMLFHALDGDSSFVQVLACDTKNRLLLDDTKPLPHLDRFFLVMLLYAIEQDSSIARKALGLTRKKGAPKRGAFAAGLALGVIEAIEELGATSMEEAWAMVAERREVSESLVKQSWIAWKKDSLFAKDVPSKEVIAKNKGTKK